MRARGAGDRHRHPGGGGRRRGHAPDDRGHRPRTGGRGADHRGRQQDRPRQRRPPAWSSSSFSERVAWSARGVGRRHHHGRVHTPPSRAPGSTHLLEQIVTVAEVEELTARVEGEARGVVLEAELEVGRGPVATVIVRAGHAARWATPLRGRCGLGQGEGAHRRPGRPHHRRRCPSTPAVPGARVLRAPQRRRRGAGGQGPEPGPHARRSPGPAIPAVGAQAGGGCGRRPARGPLRADLARRDGGDAQHCAEGRCAGFAPRR